MRCLDAEAAQEDVGGRKAEDLGIAGRVVVLTLSTFLAKAGILTRRSS